MWRRGLARLGGVTLVVVQYGCIAHCTFEFASDLAFCSGASMLPTVRPDDVLLTEHISVRRHTVQVGDIVICRSMTNPGQFLCKRLIGLAGDQVYSDESVSRALMQHVPQGHVWLEGDNKDNSTDSRSYGPVPYGLLRSRAVLRVWPLADAGWIARR